MEESSNHQPRAGLKGGIVQARAVPRTLGGHERIHAPDDGFGGVVNQSAHPLERTLELRNLCGPPIPVGVRVRMAHLRKEAPRRCYNEQHGCGVLGGWPGRGRTRGRARRENAQE
eukprot:scaffold52344_cov281-Isochrysis_galbana.AAC.2